MCLFKVSVKGCAKKHTSIAGWCWECKERYGFNYRNGSCWKCEHKECLRCPTAANNCVKCSGDWLT